MVRRVRVIIIIWVVHVARWRWSYVRRHWRRRRVIALWRRWWILSTSGTMVFGM